MDGSHHQHFAEMNEPKSWSFRRVQSQLSGLAAAVDGGSETRRQWVRSEVCRGEKCGAKTYKPLRPLHFLRLFAAQSCAPRLKFRRSPDQLSTSNSSVRSAMDAALPRRTATARMKFKDILFVTNRKIDYAAEENARQKEEFLRLEDVFLKEPAVAVSYGTARLSYPANRRRGAQNYQSDLGSQNRLLRFFGSEL